MTWTVLFLAEALADALEARRWYERRRAGLGAEFAHALARTLSRVAENPAAFPKVRREVRRAILQRFPYTVYFRLAGEAVVVLAVQGRQRPERWQLRG